MAKGALQQLELAVGPVQRGDEEPFSAVNTGKLIEGYRRGKRRRCGLHACMGLVIAVRMMTGRAAMMEA